jgi:hypothetical protein
MLHLADKRVYLASANAFVQIPPYGWTTDTLGTLYAVVTWR